MRAWTPPAPASCQGTCLRTTHPHTRTLLGLPLSRDPLTAQPPASAAFALPNSRLKARPFKERPPSGRRALNFWCQHLGRPLPAPPTAPVLGPPHPPPPQSLACLHPLLLAAEPPRTGWASRSAAPGRRRPLFPHAPLQDPGPRQTRPITLSLYLSIRKKGLLVIHHSSHKQSLVPGMIQVMAERGGGPQHSKIRVLGPNGHPDCFPLR